MLKRLAPRLFASLALFTFPVCPALGGEPIPVSFDGERAKQHVVHLASDEMEGRQSCTAGFREAAGWVASRFEAWGLEPAGEQGTYFQEVTIRDFDWNTGFPRLTLGGRDFPWDDGDFSVHRVSTPGTAVDGEIVFAGYGISAPTKGLDEYEGLDVAGRVVLVLRGSPHQAPEPNRAFAGGSTEEKKSKTEDPWVGEGKDETKLRTAHEKGAAAILLYDPAAADAGGSRRVPPPNAELLNDFLSAASRPFVVTGDYTLTDSMAERVASKGILLGVDLDPAAVDACLARLEALKDLVGRRDLLFVFPSSTEGLEEARRPLYLGLVKQGWAYREISGGGSRTSGILGGNLNTLNPGRTGGR